MILQSFVQKQYRDKRGVRYHQMNDLLQSGQ